MSFGNTPYKVTSSGGASNVCNTAVSNWAFKDNPMSGDHCTAVGHNCLVKNSTGKYNIAIGADTLSNVTTGGYNTALGGMALQALTTGSSNVAIGYAALALSIASTYPSVAVGYGALYNYNNSNSGANIAIGYQSLGSLTTGEGNVAIGYLADNSNAGSGVKNTTSSQNICIGNQATSNGNANCIVLGEGAHANANNQIILGKAGGGHTTWIQGSGGLHVNGGSTNVGTLNSGTIRNAVFSNDGTFPARNPDHNQGFSLAWNYLNDGGGTSDFLCFPQLGYGGFSFFNGTANNTRTPGYYIFRITSGNVYGGTYNPVSDLRVKKVIRNINLEESINLINNLNPILFNYTNIEYNVNDLNFGKNTPGYLAQDVLILGYDNLVNKTTNHTLEEETHNGFKSEKGLQYSMNYSGIIPYQGLVIKHLLKENEDLKLRLSAIEARLAAAGI